MSLKNLVLNEKRWHLNTDRAGLIQSVNHRNTVVQQGLRTVHSDIFDIKTYVDRKIAKTQPANECGVAALETGKGADEPILVVRFSGWSQITRLSN